MANFNDCMDLSVRGQYFIAYFPNTLPGCEYEILSSNDLVDCDEKFQIGSSVISQLGSDQIEGEVIAISAKRSDLTLHFNSITSRHRLKLEENVWEVLRQIPGLLPKHYIKIANTETQTTETDNDENDWKRKCTELEAKIDKLQSTLSGVCSSVVGKKLTSISDVMDEEEGNSGVSENCMPGPSSSNGSQEATQMVSIGSNGTTIPKQVFDDINWLSYTAATRKLLITIFPRDILATHSLTGKASPAFLNTDKQQKMRLNPIVVSDIVEVVSQKCSVPGSLVRNSISTKCADEYKLYRQRLKKPEKTSDASCDPMELDDEKKQNIRC